MGWHCSDTAHITFDNYRVSRDYLLGEPKDGLKVVMNNFNMERFALAAMAVAFSDVCYEVCKFYCVNFVACV